MKRIELDLELRNDAEFETALREYEGYFEVEPDADSPSAARFVALGAALSTYDASQANNT